MKFWFKNLKGPDNDGDGYEIVTPPMEDQEEINNILIDPSRRAELRKKMGLPDDGKIWCDVCQVAHVPPEHTAKKGH